MAYATIAQLKREIGLDSSDTSQDLYLTDLLDWVSSWIDTYTRRTFSSTAVSLTEDFYDETGRRAFWLSQVGVTEITSVKAKFWQADDFTTLTADQYEWTPRGRVRLWWYWRARFVEIVYKYASAAPKAVEGACVEAAARVYRNNGVSSEAIGDYKVAYNKAEDVFGETGVLDAFRLRQV